MLGQAGHPHSRRPLHEVAGMVRVCLADGVLRLYFCSRSSAVLSRSSAICQLLFQMSPTKSSLPLFRSRGDASHSTPDGRAKEPTPAPHCG